MSTLNRAGPRRPAGDNLTAYLRGLGDRVDRVERSRRISYSSISGTLRVEQGGRIAIGPDGGPVLSLEPPAEPGTLELATGLVDGAAYVDAAWSPVPGVSSFDVFVEEDGVGTIRVERTSATLIRLAPLGGDRDHTVRVAAVSAVGVPSSAVSSTIRTAEVPGQGAPTAPPTDAPTPSVAGAFGSLIISWPRVDDADRYRVEIDDELELEDVSASVVSVLADPGDHDVRVAAGNAQGYGPWSDVVVGTVAALPGGRDFTTDPIESTEIADDAITTPKLTANAVVAGKIATDAVETRHVVAGAITADEIVSTGITAALITAGTMSGDRIAVGTLEGDRIIAGTLTAGAIGTGTLTATTITLGAGGLLRAGRTVSPFHYLTLSADGLVFRASGSAPFTGGTERLRLDVATGAATLSGVTVTGTINATGGTFTGGITVSGTITGGLIRTSATGNRVELDGSGNLIRFGHAVLGNPSAIAESTIRPIASNSGNSSNGESSAALIMGIGNGELAIRLMANRGWFSGGSGYGDNSVEIGARGFSDTTPFVAPSFGGMTFTVHGTTVVRGQLFVDQSISASQGITAGNGGFYVNSNSYRDHFTMRRSINEVDLTVSGSNFRVLTNGTIAFTAGAGGTQVVGPLTVDGADISNYGSMQRARTLTQSMANNSWTRISWNSTPYSSPGWSGLTTGISPPVFGRFLVTVSLNLGWSQSVGQRTAVRLTLNGNGLDEHRRDDFPSISGWSLTLSTVIRLTPSDRVDVEVFQNSGGARTLNAGSTVDVTYLGPF